MGRKYRNPPIIEAVCEFRLTPATKWDLAVPGLVYEKVQADFPKRERRSIRETQLVEGPEGLLQEVRVTEAAVFRSEKGNVFAQVGPRLLAVNCIRPYVSWEDFKPSIERAFRALSETVAIERFARIGLLYVNRIEIPGGWADLDKYFEFRPFLGPRLPQHMSSLMLGCILPFSEEGEICRVELTTVAPDKPDTVVLLLTLDYSFVQPKAVAPDKALAWIETAHSHVEDVFEGCITDCLREIFHEVK